MFEKILRLCLPLVEELASGVCPLVKCHLNLLLVFHKYLEKKQVELKTDEIEPVKRDSPGVYES